MEKRNIIEDGRTPHMDEQPDLDAVEKSAALLFKAVPDKTLPAINKGGDAFSDKSVGR